MGTRLQAVDNVKIFNSIRAGMDDAFKERIPKATADNLAEIGSALTSSELQTKMNEWQGALVNRIGMTIFVDYTLKNRLAKYIYGNMEFGDAIEIIAADVITGAAMDYGKEGESVDPFVKTSNQVKAQYNLMNKPIQYSTTIERDRVKKAFVARYGFQHLLSLLVSKLTSSANYDTWLITKATIAHYANDNKTALPLLPQQKVTMPEPTTASDARAFILQMKNYISALGFINNLYNPQQLHKTVETTNLVLFIKYSIVNQISVDLLSAAFNPEHLGLDVTIELMDDFGNDYNGVSANDIFAILAEQWWLLITQQFEEMDVIYNPRGRYYNYFLTRKMSFGTNFFRDVIIFRPDWTILESLKAQAREIKVSLSKEAERLKALMQGSNQDFQLEPEPV